MNCRFTVLFSTSFSTTRLHSKKTGLSLSCRHNHPRLRHFLDNFGEGRLSRLLFCFSFTHCTHDFTSRWPATGQLGSANPATIEARVVTTFSSFRSSDLSQSI